MVIVNYGDKKAYMDGYLRNNLELYKLLVKKSRDLVFVVTGYEREGKSTIANSILKYLDPTFDLNRCAFNGEDFIDMLDKAKNFQAICYDEAQEFTSRGAITKFNRQLVQALSVIGMKQLYIAICLPSFFELDRYPAIHRSNFLIRVYSTKGKRGYFEFWNREKKKKLYLFGKKSMNYFEVSPNFRGCFVNKAFPFNKEDYTTRKFEALHKVLGRSREGMQNRFIAQRNALIKHLVEKKGMQQTDVADLLTAGGASINKRTISDIIQNR